MRWKREKSRSQKGKASFHCIAIFTHDTTWRIMMNSSISICRGVNARRRIYFLFMGKLRFIRLRLQLGVKSTEEPPWWREPLGIIAHMILFCSVVRKVPFNAQLDVLWSSSFLVSIRRRQLDIDVGLVRCVMKCLEYLRGCKILSTIEDSEMRESY